MKKLIYATTNNYKLTAANTALREFSVQLERISDSLPEVAEIQDDLQEAVALDKARKYFKLLKQPLVVMDSGLFIEGLKGFPGVYTKYALETLGVDGLLTLTHQLKDRRAYTERTVVYIDDHSSKVFSYRCKGKILLEKRGHNGRDYDFIFCEDKTSKTLAEMTEEEKADISGDAWRKLGKWLQEKQ